ncbi:MAG: 2-C-methyl-D-erythritol 4-phosphate cytidylyltransferase [Paludibacteraceae bacterium]|nr:2-C-methyl-D-erythritol 4-phosphate cytidylyltransferase [Paludibacteraceae bacterium]
MKTFHNIAVLLAGGEGKRAGGAVPKQLRILPDGRSVLQTCIDTFRTCAAINDIWVVMHRDWLSFVPKGVYVTEGGKERWESSYRAIQAISNYLSSSTDDKRTAPQDVNILLHDVARPFISSAVIERVCKALETCEAVSVAIPVTDTIYQVQLSASDTEAAANMTLQSIPPRSIMMRAQTPQAFRLPVIQRAFDLAVADYDRITATDDAGIVRRYLPAIPVRIVPGEETNRKITFAEDFLCQNK